MDVHYEMCMQAHNFILNRIMHKAFNSHGHYIIMRPEFSVVHYSETM